MSLMNWLRKLVSGAAKKGGRRSRSRWPHYQLCLESLEARETPATDITISTAATAGGTFVLTGGIEVFTPNPLTNTATVNNGDIETFLNAGTSVTIDTTNSMGLNPGNITEAAGATIQKTSGAAATLTLYATNNLAVSQAISSISNALAVSLLTGGATTVSAGITTNGGSFTADTNSAAATTFDNTGGVIATTGGFIDIFAQTLLTVGANLTSGNGFIFLEGTGVTQLAAVTVNAGNNTITVDGGGAAVNLGSGTLTSTSSGAGPADIEVEDASTVALGNVTDPTVGGNFETFNITGAITQNAATTLSIDGLAVSSGGGSITLGNSNNVGILTALANGAITFNDGITNLDIGLFGTGIDSGGNNVTLTTTGSLTIGQGNGEGIVATGAFVNLTAGSISEVAVTTPSSISAGTLTTGSVTGTTLNNGNTVGTFSAANTTSGNIVLTNTANPLTITGITESGGGSVTVNNAGAISITGLVSTIAGGAVNLTASGTLGETGAGLVNTAGTLTTFSSGGTTLNGANTVSAFGAINAGVGNVALTNTASPLTIISINEMGGGSITLSNTGTTILNGGLITAGGAILVGGAVTLGNIVTVDTTDDGDTPAGANITFTSTINGAQSLILTAGTAGAIALQGAVGGTTPLASLTATATTAIDLQAVKTTGAQSYTGPTSLSGNLTTAGGTIQINGFTALLATVTVDTTNAGASPGGANITFNGAIGVTNLPALVVTAGTTGVISMGTVGNNVVGNNSLTSLIVSGSAINLLSSVSTSGPQTYTGALTMDGAVTAGGPIQINGPVSLGAGPAGFDTTANGNVPAGANITFTSTIDGAQAFFLTAGTAGAISMPAAVGSTAPLTSMFASGGTISVLTGVTTTGQQTYTGALTLDAVLVTAGAPIQVNGAVTVQGAGAQLSTTNLGTVPAGANITFTSTINGTLPAPGNLILGAGTAGAIALQGAVGGTTPLNALTASGGTLGVPNVTTTSRQTYQGNTTLNGNLTTAGGNVQFGGESVTLAANVAIDTSNAGGTLGGIDFNTTIDGAFALALNAGSGNIFDNDGNIVLQLAVGSSVPLKSLAIGQADQVRFFGPVTTSGNLTELFVDGTTINAPVDTTGGGISLTTNALALAANVSAPAGTIAFDAIGNAIGNGVTQTQGILTAPSLLLTGNGTFTLPDANNIANLAASITGPLTFNDAGALTLGTVLATAGVTATGNVAITAGSNLTVTNAVTTQGTSTLQGNGAITVNAVVTGSPIMIAGGAGADTITVNVTGPNAATNTLNLDGKAGNDTYLVNFTSPFGTVVSPVNINDSGPQSDYNTAIVHGNNVAETLTITNGSVASSVNGVVNYTGLENLMVVGQAGGSQFNIQSTIITTAVAGTAGNDTYSINSPSNGLAGIQGVLSLSGGGTLVASEAGSESGDNLILTNSAILSNAGVFQAILLQGPFSIALTTGAVASTVNVISTTANAPTTVTTAGSDVVVVSSQLGGNGTLNTLLSPLTLVAAAGSDTLITSESGSQANDSVILGPSIVQSNSGVFPAITYQAAGGTFGVVAFATGRANESVTVEATAANSSTFVYALGTTNGVVVSSSPLGNGSLAGIQGPLIVDAGAGITFLDISDGANPSASSYSILTWASLERPDGVAPILFGTGGTFAAVVLQMGQGNDSINIRSTLPSATLTDVLTGAGNDSITVSSAPGGNGDLHFIQGPLSIDAGAGSNQLIVGEGAQAAGDAVDLSSTTISSALGFFHPISYAATGGRFASSQAVISSLGTVVQTGITLILGHGSNSVNVSSLLAGSATYIDMGSGGNSATVDVTSASNYRGLTVDLGTGSNSLNVEDLSGTGQTFIFPGAVAGTGTYEVSYGGTAASFIDFVGFLFQTLF